MKENSFKKRSKNKGLEKEKLDEFYTLKLVRKYLSMPELRAI